MPKIHSKKLIIVGDNGVGKTSLVTAFSTGSFPKVTDTSAFKVYHEDIILDNNDEVHFTICDTPGEDDYDRIRPVLAYHHADMYLICFALNSKESLKNCVKKWRKEVKMWSPMKPQLLVGLKKDTMPVMLQETLDEILDIATEIKAVQYVDCSSYTMDGVEEVFQLAAKEVLIDQGKQNRCTIL